MAELSRDMLQRLTNKSRGDTDPVDTAVRSVRGSVILAASRGQRWWSEEVFDADHPHRHAVTTATVGAVLEKLFRIFPDSVVRYVYEASPRSGRMRRILEIDWS